MNISAQVSLYPLGQEALAPEIEETLDVLRRHGLEVEPGSMSTVVRGEDALIFAALQEAFQSVCSRGRAVMTVVFSNACPPPPPGS